MGRILSSIAIFFLVFAGLYWTWETQPAVRKFVKERLNSGFFLTLEILYSPEDILEKYKTHIKNSNEHELLEPKLIFHPYTLMEVKFLRREGGTGEGVMLWGLLNGEMVLDTHTWKLTHGYEDCILAKASRYDFKIINTLANHGGFLDREGLLSALFIENDLLDRWIESCKNKHLIVQKGNDYYLHFEKPLLAPTPETYLAHSLVKKTYKYSERMPARFTISQIERLANNSFGENFTIKTATEVYLPVYLLSIKNPDGSTRINQWNGVTGEQMENYFLNP